MKPKVTKTTLIRFVVVSALLSGALFLSANPWADPADSPSMTIETPAACDVDRDGDCDADDYAQVAAVVGECDDGDNYHELADADHDGCVTAEDVEELFPDY